MGRLTRSCGETRIDGQPDLCSRLNKIEAFNGRDMPRVSRRMYAYKTILGYTWCLGALSM